MVDVYLKGLKALGLDADEVRAILLARGIVAEVNRRGEHSPVLVVCMIAGKLCSAGDKNLFFHFIKPLFGVLITEVSTYIRIPQNT